jgi:hypothetical protein
VDDTDYVPPGFLSLKDAVDLTGRRLFNSAWTGKEIRQLPQPPPKRPLRRLEDAVHELRGLLANDKVPAVAVAESGQKFSVPTALWLSEDGRRALNTGLLPTGNLRETLKAKQDRTLRRRILVPKGPLEMALKGTARPKRKGRPRGSGSLASEDEPLLHLMRQLLESREARSIHEAASKVAAEAAGGGTPESKTKRLTERYSEKFRKSQR